MAVDSGFVTFACPCDKTVLSDDHTCPSCGRHYPSVGDVPVLINEDNSVFRIADYLDQASSYGGASDYGGSLDHRGGLRGAYRRFVHRLSEAELPSREFDVHAALKQVLAIKPDAHVLVIGAGDTTFDGDVVYTDVAFGKNVSCIADAHDLPFPDHSFDACVACAVLEHVADPQLCVSEMVRVLRPGGFVYAETPFMQPVHMRAHDFTRFTYLGHRRLFRRFDDIRSGMAGGPGVSTGQVLRCAFASVSDRPGQRRWLKLTGLLLAQPLRWVDRMLVRRASAYDVASAFYFFGSLREGGAPIADRDLLQLYRGG